MQIWAHQDNFQSDFSKKIDRKLEILSSTFSLEVCSCCIDVHLQQGEERLKGKTFIPLDR